MLLLFAFSSGARDILNRTWAADLLDSWLISLSLNVFMCKVGPQHLPDEVFVTHGVVQI